MQLETCVPSYMVDVTIDESELPLLHQIMSQKCMKQYHIGIYYSPHIHLPSSKMCFSIFDRFRDVAKWQYSQIRMFFVCYPFFILPEIDCDIQCNRGEYPTKISFWQWLNVNFFMASTRLEVETFNVLDKCDNQLDHDTFNVFKPLIGNFVNF